MGRCRAGPPICCTKCARKGRYRVRRLIEKYGRKGNMMKWKEQLNGDCLRRDAFSLHKRCNLVCPDCLRSYDPTLEEEQSHQAPVLARLAATAARLLYGTVEASDERAAEACR
jgi:hypothetical protein